MTEKKEDFVMSEVARLVINGIFSDEPFNELRMEKDYILIHVEYYRRQLGRKEEDERTKKLVKKINSFRSVKNLKKFWEEQRKTLDRTLDIHNRLFGIKEEDTTHEWIDSQYEDNYIYMSRSNKRADFSTKQVV